MKRFFVQLLTFAYHQTLSCVFPVLILMALALTKVIEWPGLYRYDWLLVICIAAQIMMVWTKLESWDELKVICVFHLIGLALELYKVHMGSWSYPEPGWSKIAGVPLYSGFMYASVASYICQSWRRLKLQIEGWPSSYLTVGISASIYLNFFTHHVIWDLRWVLTALLLLIFWRSFVSFELRGVRYKMPLTLSFLLIGFFIWIAENISTFLGAWTYPDQTQTWKLVHIGKISSWFLLVVISIIIVAQLKHIKQGNQGIKNGANDSSK